MTNEPSHRLRATNRHKPNLTAESLSGLYKNANLSEKVMTYKVVLKYYITTTAHKLSPFSFVGKT